jgi:hypothetical protein
MAIMVVVRSLERGHLSSDFEHFVKAIWSQRDDLAQQA